MARWLKPAHPVEYMIVGLSGLLCHVVLPMLALGYLCSRLARVLWKADSREVTR